MTTDLEQREIEIDKDKDKEYVRVAIIQSPGAVLGGIGLYAVFAADGDAFLPILNNQTFVYAILAVSGAIMLWGFFKNFSLARERLQKERSLMDNLTNKGNAGDEY